MEEISERALLLLSEIDRSVIDARENLGMSYHEMGLELGCKPANAKLKYSRAKERHRGKIARIIG